MNTSDHEEDDRPSDASLALMLKKAFDEESPKPSLLPGIQERIRIHTRGRYFRRKDNPLRNPTLLLLATGCFLLVLAAVLYASLGSLLLSKKAPAEKATETTPHQER